MSFKIRDHTKDRTIDVGSRKAGEDKLEEFEGDLELDLLKDGEIIACNYEDPNRPEPIQSNGGEVEVVDEPEVIEDTTDVTPAPQRGVIDLENPQDHLPSWMLTEITHGNGESGIDLNKDGTQVVAGALELEVNGEHTVTAHETDFEYSRYKAVVTRPDGREFTAIGDCHIDEQGKNKWDLDRQSETRAKKRAVKWCTAGGIEALDQ